MAASATSQRIPPWRGHMGLACATVGRKSISASPGLTEIRSKPISCATGGGGASPRAIASLRSRNVVIAASRDKLCSLVEASENERRVGAAEAETVRQRVLHARLARFVCDIVQVAFRVRSLVVNSWGQFPAMDGQRGEDGFDPAGRAEQMPRHRLRGAERQLISMGAECFLDRQRFTPVTQRSRSAMRVDVADRFRTDARILNSM